MAATMLMLLAWNFLPLCCVSPSNPFLLLFVSPIVLGLGLASYDDLDRFLRGSTPFGPSDQILAILGYGLCFHLLAGLALWGFCVSHFEAAVDRPRRVNPMKRGPLGKREADQPFEPGPA
jgi:hypothetical protein